MRNKLMVLMVLCVLGVNLFPVQATIQRRAAVKALPNQSVSFDSATVTSVDNQDVLTFNIRAEAASTQVVAFVVNSEGKITGGQGFAANTAERNSVILRNKVSEADRIILAAWNMTDATSELVNSVKMYARGQLNAHSASKAKPISQQTYCSAALMTAQSACSCGVSSFSCTEGSSYSFSCNPPKKDGDACQEGGASE